MSHLESKIFAQEFHSNEIKSYLNNGKGSAEVISSVIDPGAFSRSVKSLLQSVFLPAGFPDSVSPDYIQYQIWDSLQAFCSSLTHTLATHAVLKGAGVGDASATPLAATITWLLKDGTGMLGSILFAYYRGTRLDSECKKWRLFADIVNDTSFFIDLTSFHFPSFFMPIQCLSGLMRSLVGVAGGATRAALTQHQARRNNLADVSAKDSSQETLVNLIALMVNLVIVPIVVKSSTVVWTMFFLLTFLHIFCNYKAVRAVNMEVFNMSRLMSTVNNFLMTGEVLSPSEANRAENVWFLILESYPFHLGISLSEHQDLIRTFEDQKEQKYVISRKNEEFFVSIQKSATSQEIVKSLFHGMLLNEKAGVVIADRGIDDKFDIFVEKCKLLGWSLGQQHLNCGEYRYDPI